MPRAEQDPPFPNPPVSNAPGAGARHSPGRAAWRVSTRGPRPRRQRGSLMMPPAQLPQQTPWGCAAAEQAEAGAKAPMRAQNLSMAAPVMLHTRAASGLHSPAHPLDPCRCKEGGPGRCLYPDKHASRQKVRLQRPQGAAPAACSPEPRSLGGVQLRVPGTTRVQAGEVPAPRTPPSGNLERQLRAQRVT